MRRDRDNKREHLSFELTPLVDVIFLLLIFFLVTSTFKKNELALLLNLPLNAEGKAQPQKDLKSIVIELTEEKIAFNKEELTDEAFSARVSAIVNKTVPVILRADKDVKYNRVIEILGVLQKYQIPNLNLITDSKVPQ